MIKLSKNHRIAEEWYCYVCGGKIKEEFYLFSARDSTDRPFTACSLRCLAMVDSTPQFPTYYLKVNIQKNKEAVSNDKK